MEWSSCVCASALSCEGESLRTKATASCAGTRVVVALPIPPMRKASEAAWEKSWGDLPATEHHSVPATLAVAPRLGAASLHPFMKTSEEDCEFRALLLRLINSGHARNKPKDLNPSQGEIQHRTPRTFSTIPIAQYPYTGVLPSAHPLLSRFNLRLFLAFALSASGVT